jgi:hypothetical protein
VPEDLIVMRAIAHRPRDVADIESILEASPGIDEARIRSLVRDFAAALEAPRSAPIWSGCSPSGGVEPYEHRPPPDRTAAEAGRLRRSWGRESTF